MANGNTALLDALGALLVAIALIAVSYNVGTAGLEIGMPAIERERLRQEFYKIISTGNATELLNRCIEEGTSETDLVSVSLGKPNGTTFVTFFMSGDGGIVTFYITKKG